jgi:PucR family transcriptional regulator, purine catabolism regulatory protein
VLVRSSEAPPHKSVYSQPVAITVAELVAVPFLKMRFHAGVAGGTRLVTWAHTSDLPHPTEWLAPGDLLMSNGLNVPADGGEQVKFLESLASAGLSGLAIGDDMHSPPLTTAFLMRAEELAFPLLAIPHEVPFVAVSRAVANANSDEEHGRLVRTVQLYDVLRGAVSSGRLGATLLRALGRQLRCRLVVLDTTSGLPVFPGDEPAPAGLVERLAEEVRARRGVFPGVLRVEHEDAVAFAIRVPAERPTALVALHDGHPPPDLALLQHAANIAALEVERVNAEREHERRLGSELMAHLLERRLDPASAQRRLEEHGIDPGRVVLVAFRPPASGAREGDLHHEFAQRGLPHLVLWSVQRSLIAVPDHSDGVEALRSALGAEVALGVSDPIRRPDRVPDAAREARWAQTAAHSLGRPVVRYGEGTPLFLPRTLGEAETAAERVMGPVVAYDEAHATELVRSLAVFLEHNRSWQRSAQVLHVHKQTLVYRMHKVEELTGRSLRETADVVQLWLALRALEFAHGELKLDAPEAR